MKIGIIRCGEHSNNCAGFHCFPALQEKKGSFERYGDIELIGFDTCGGCGRGKADKILEKATKLKERGAEVIHLGNCLVHPCPTVDLYEKTIQDELEIEVVRGTHP